MKLYQIMIGVGLFIGFLFFCSCNSKSYELEDLSIDSGNGNLDSGIKQEIREPNLEIKEETVNPKPIVYVYSIQMGAFFDEKNAREFIDKLKKILPYDISYQLIDNFYKVRAGRFSNKEQASTELNKLKNLGYKDAFIIEFPK